MMNNSISIDDFIKFAPIDDTCFRVILLDQTQFNAIIPESTYGVGEAYISGLNVLEYLRILFSIRNSRIFVVDLADTKKCSQLEELDFVKLRNSLDEIGAPEDFCVWNDNYQIALVFYESVDFMVLTMPMETYESLTPPRISQDEFRRYCLVQADLSSDATYNKDRRNIIDKYITPRMGIEWH